MPARAQFSSRTSRSEPSYNWNNLEEIQMRSFVFAALLLSLPAAAEYAAADLTNGGTIKGKITYNGKPPPPKKIMITKDPKICGTSRDDDTFEIAPDGGVRNVVVYLADIKSGKKFEGEMKPELDQKGDRKSTRLNSSHGYISYAVFCLKKKKTMKSKPIELSRPA